MDNEVESIQESEGQEPGDGEILRSHLFEGDLLQLPQPEEMPDMMPAWFEGGLPVLVYPPLAERGFEEGAQFNLEVTPYHIYYGALRELAETADAERSEMLRKLVLEWNPNAAHEVNELARARLQEDVESALLHYELAQEIDDEMYEAVQDGGMCQYALSAVQDQDRDERLDEAEAMFRRAIELQPASGLSWWSLARTLNERGQGAEANAVLRQFLNDYPEGEGREMVEEALVHGFEAHEVEEMEEGAQAGGEDQALFQQAQALAFGENPAQAVELIRPLAERYPESAEVWFVLGAASRRTGDLPEAERCLRRAARLAPQEPFIWFELAGSYMDDEDWSHAEEAIRKALELDPENPGFLCDLGRILLAQGDRAGAEEAVTQARELVGDDPQIMELAGQLGISQENDALP
jgi:Flp pilus assembly protein TadD